MESISVQAVYKKGVLKPRQKLDLPEDSVVDVLVRPIIPKKGQSKTLFGALPSLSAITGKDLSRVKQQWKHALEKQSRIIRGTKQ
jgi:predicted DNA-binding antitoxin AbrB/MazE fold protein